LVPILIDELRRRRILLPSAAVLEMIVHQARARAESTVHRALLEGLGTDTRASLDRLLEPMPEETMSRLAWLRTAQQSPAARNILGLTERVRFVRTLGIDRKRRQDIPAQAFERLADEGLRMTAQHLRDLTGPRRHAVLCASMIKLYPVELEISGARTGSHPAPAAPYPACDTARLGAHQPDRRLYLGRRGRSGRGCAAVAAGQAIAASSMSCSIIPA
jgi:hypothetical protein